MIDEKIEFPYLEEKLSNFCNLPVKPIGILGDFLKTQGITRDYNEIVADLNEDYKAAYDSDAITITSSKIIFATRYLKDDGTFIEVILKPSEYIGRPWFLYYVDTNVKGDHSSMIPPGKQLENFAFLGSWTSFLSDLADKAIPEEWDFQSTADGQYRILIQYIKYTFSRLLAEKKVCITKDEQFAAFNTGLVDSHYDDIFACFTPNPVETGSKWRFAGFCTAASGNLGKLLVRNFNQLPEPPSYFSRKQDLIYNHLKPLYVDFRHVIIDNISRLPLQFLYDQSYSNDEAKSIITQLKAKTLDIDTRSELYAKLRTILLDDNQLFKRLSNRIQDAIELAKKRVRWNYRTAIPLYYPKNNSMSLMLPLALVDDMKADIALVVELMPSGSYQGQTILTLAQAYINARLVCRLTGDWLEPSMLSEYQPDIEEALVD